MRIGSTVEYSGGVQPISFLLPIPVMVVTKKKKLYSNVNIYFLGFAQTNSKGRLIWAKIS